MPEQLQSRAIYVIVMRSQVKFTIYDIAKQEIKQVLSPYLSITTQREPGAQHVQAGEWVYRLLR